MSNIKNPHTKKIVSYVLCALLSAFTLSSYAVIQNPAYINVNMTVNIENLPKGWNAYPVWTNFDWSGTLPTQIGSHWTGQIQLPVQPSRDNINTIGTSKMKVVVFLFDQNGKRKGSFKYGAVLSSNSNLCQIGVGPLYQNDGAVSFNGLQNTPDTTTSAQWNNVGSCGESTGYATYNITYNFIIK